MLTVTKQPTVAQDLDIQIEGSSPWKSPSSVLTSDNLAAMNDFNVWTGSGVTNYLYVSGFGFNIPNDPCMRIGGFEVAIERKGVGGIDDYYVGLMFPDGSGGMEITYPGLQKTGYWPTNDQVVVYGGTDEIFNRSWTPDEINSTNFGFAIAVQGNVVDLDAALIDHIQISVHYGNVCNEVSSGGIGAGGDQHHTVVQNIVSEGGAYGGGLPYSINNEESEGGIGVGGNSYSCAVYSPLETNKFGIVAVGHQVVPPYQTNKTAAIEISVNEVSNEVSWVVSHSFAAPKQINLRGPATKKKNANVLILLGGLSGGFESPLKDSVIVSDTIKNHILNELTYVFLETYGGKKIRAQVEAPNLTIAECSCDVQCIYDPLRSNYSEISLLADFDEEGTGGSELTGEAIIEVTYTLEGDAGAEIAGASDFFKIVSPTTSGGAGANGEGLEDSIFNPTTSGGIDVNGDGVEQFTYNIEVEDGVELNGSTVVGIHPFIEGGAEVSGSHDKQAILQPQFDGDGALASPEHDSTTFYSSDIPEGGGELGTKAFAEKRKFFDTVRTGYARTLNGDNIVKAAEALALRGPQIIGSDIEDIESPDRSQQGIRYLDLPGWCDFDEDNTCPNDAAYLPDIIQNRQGQDRLPPKERGQTEADSTIARVS